jgi:tRNA pseudouridine13 synthase
LTVLRDSERQRIISFLGSHPHDFRRAITLIPHDLRSLWLAAFQSHLWNQVLASLVRQTCDPQQCISHNIGRQLLPFFSKLDHRQRRELQSASLPLPSARLHLEGDLRKAIYDQVLAAEGMEMRQLRVKYPRDSFFSKGDRAVVVQPAEFEYEPGDDELYPGKKRLSLRFALPRGAYATILLKSLFGGGSVDLGQME